MNITVHQKNGRSASAKSTVKLVYNHVLGGLRQTVSWDMRLRKGVD